MSVLIHTIIPAARLHLIVLGLTSALIVLTGCSTSHSVTELPGGITVHTFRRDYTNAHVVSRGEAFFMVDAGLEANAPALAEDLRSEGFDPARLRAIILTHGHADHAGGAAWFRRQFGTRIIAGEADVPILAAGANDHLCPTSDRARDRVTADQEARFTPFAPDVSVGTEVALEGLVGITGTVTPMPGHTPGSLVVTISGAALVGDPHLGDHGWWRSLVRDYRPALGRPRRCRGGVHDRRRISQPRPGVSIAAAGLSLGLRSPGPAGDPLVGPGWQQRVTLSGQERGFPHPRPDPAPRARPPR